MHSATGTDQDLSEEEIEALDRLRVGGRPNRFATACLQCGAPIRGAHFVSVTADLIEDGAPYGLDPGPAMILAVGFRVVPDRKLRRVVRSLPSGGPSDRSDPSNGLAGERRKVKCERGHGPWPIKTETWFRKMLDADRLGVAKIYVP